MNRRARLFAALGIVALVAMTAVSVLFPMLGTQSESSVEMPSSKTIAIRNTYGNLSSTYDDIRSFGGGNFNVSIATDAIQLDNDLQRILVKSIMHRQLVYEVEESLNLSFAEKMSISYGEDRVVKQVPEGVTFIDSDISWSTTKSYELILNESVIDEFDVSSITVQNELAFGVNHSDYYAIDYAIHMDVILVHGRSLPYYVPMLHVGLLAFGIFSMGMLLVESNKLGSIES